MPVNKYFAQNGGSNSNGFNSEQMLMEDIFVECIKISGTEAFYIIRDDVNVDLIYGEDPLKTFTSSFPIEIYNSDYTSFEGQQEMFSKFGMTLKTEYTVMLSRRTFLQRVPFNAEYQRPREGDLIWIPDVRGMLYEITFCNPEKDFFLLGRPNPYYYELKLEAFKYSEELINTGQEDIDDIRKEHAYTIALSLITGGSGEYFVNEIVYQGNSLDTATATGYVNNWDAPSLTLSVSNIMGEFVSSANVIGSTSGSQYTLQGYNALQHNLAREPMDNAPILNEALLSEIFTDSNPLGAP